jgi:hypothetical protein
VKWLGRERKTESVQKRVKNTNLVRPRRKTVDPEFAEGIGDDRDLCSIDHHIRARQKSAVQTIEDDAGNLGCSRFAGRGWYRRRFLLSDQLLAGEENSEH